MAPLLVVDTPYLLYRAFHSLPKTITDGQGRPVNALLGTANQLLRTVEEEAPRAVVLCFGPDAAEYGVEEYAGYHAERPPVPDELAPQFAAAPTFFEAFGWTSLVHDSLEADDLLHSLSLVEAKAGGKTLILTGDRDMFASATKQTTILLIRPGKPPDRMGPAEVVERYGIGPELVADFIALRGDPSDGIPGAKGIGEKTAADLLQRHGSLEAAIEAAADANVLSTMRDQLLAFKRVATLQRCEVERPADGDTDRAGGAVAARALGMNGLAKRLGAGSV